MSLEPQPKREKPFSLLDPRVIDPDGEIVERGHLSDETLAQVVEVMEAMNLWRDTERLLSERARRYMHLGDTDMRALRVLLAAERHGVATTPRALAERLGITPAATTKLLDRLADGAHITRAPMPGDRRSTSIHVTPETKTSARASVGRSHSRRFEAIAALSDDDRAAVLRFYEALTSSADWSAGEAPSA